MERPTKRRKLQDQDENDFSYVTRPDQIHQWLEFQQSTDPSIKDQINTFKNYLAFVQQLDDVSQQSKHLRILKEYCEWQKAPSNDQLDFYDLLSTWSLATENNAEAIISTITASLAQFLKTISGVLELRPFGLALIDALLRRDQSKLFEKSLASPRTKPHLASPCLRLLTEMASFDAGERITDLWARRDLFMQRFDIALEQQNSGADLQERRKPSVRRMALRLLLIMLKYLDSDAKVDLIGQARVLHACLRGLAFDADDILIEILHSLDSNLVSDASIPRASLVKFFNSNRLEILATLYRYSIDDEDDESTKDAVRDAVHRLLLHLCTIDQGILLHSQGWYPPFSNMRTFQAQEEDFIDLGLDSPFYADDYSNGVPLVNATLSTFLSKLRAQDDALQAQLLIQILREAPELVADYFQKHKALPNPASDDVGWRSAFASLFSIIELSVPPTFEKHAERSRNPPPPTIVVENIVPKPLDRAYLEKLFHSKDKVLKISGARILTVVLKKLASVRSEFSRFSNTNTYAWNQVSRKVSELVQARIPVVREVLLALQHTSHTEAATYTVLLECVHEYFQVLPNATATSTFDVGPVMVELCTALERDGPKSESYSATLEQLSYASQIASLSSSTKWLQKANSETLSSLGQLFKVAIEAGPQNEAQNILRTIGRVLVYRGVLHSNPASLNALCNSFSSTKKFSPSAELFLFLDNCVTRANKKPVKYLDDIDAASHLLSDKKPLSLFIGALPEQWSFACRKYEGQKGVVKTIATWITRLFSLLDSAGENYRVMSHFYDSMLQESGGKAKEYLQAAFDKTRKKPIAPESALFQVGGPVTDPVLENSDATAAEKTASTATVLQSIIDRCLPVPDSLENLDKWPTTLDIELEIRTDRLPKLLLCLSSPSEEIRLQAFQYLQSITHTVDTHSTHEGKAQIHLVLAELIESIKQYNQSGQHYLNHQQPIDHLPSASPSASPQTLPTLLPTLATTLLHITLQPTHPLYAKTNKFLLHSPIWTPKRTVTYWLEKILCLEPDSAGSDEPNAFAVEVVWLLTWFLDGLRTRTDLDVFRRAGVWERVLSLYVSPVLRHNGGTAHSGTAREREMAGSEMRTGLRIGTGQDTPQEQIPRLILALIWQACEIEGGADMLWTRFGVERWLEGRLWELVSNAGATVANTGASNGDGEMGPLIQAVQDKLREKSDGAMIEKWEVSCAANRARGDEGGSRDVDMT